MRCGIRHTSSSSAIAHCYPLPLLTGIMVCAVLQSDQTQAPKKKNMYIATNDIRTPNLSFPESNINGFTEFYYIQALAHIHTHTHIDRGNRARIAWYLLDQWNTQSRVFRFFFLSSFFWPSAYSVVPLRDQIDENERESHLVCVCVLVVRSSDRKFRSGNKERWIRFGFMGLFLQSDFCLAGDLARLNEL